MIKREVLIFAVLFIVMSVFSGCERQAYNKQTALNQTQSEQNQQNMQIQNSPEEVVNLLPNGEIDMSDWKEYEYKPFKISFLYPSFLHVEEFVSSDDGHSNIVFGSYDGDSEWSFSCTYTYPFKFKYSNSKYLGNKTFDELTYEEIAQGYKEIYSDSIDFQEYDYEKGKIFYGEKDMRGEDYIYKQYEMSAFIINDEKWIMNCEKVIDPSKKKVIENEIEDDKYGIVIKAILKSFKSINIK